MKTDPRPLRVAITGASGLLGRTLVPLLISRGHTVIAGCHRPAAVPDSPAIKVALDLPDPSSITAFVEQAHAEWIIHCAALTDVDRCEQEPDLARAINTTATACLTGAIADAGAKLVLLSTDYVFDGANGPYDENASVNPINVYGRTKLDAERIVQDSKAGAVIVRSASFLGAGAPERPTWVDRMAERMLHQPPLTVATDQRSNITPVEFLASAIVDAVENDKTGLRHIAGDQILSRFEFALRLARLLGLPSGVVRAVRYQDLNRPAARPLNGGLITRFPDVTPQEPLDASLTRWKESYLRQHSY